MPSVQAAYGMYLASFTDAWRQVRYAPCVDGSAPHLRGCRCHRVLGCFGIADELFRRPASAKEGFGLFVIVAGRIARGRIFPGLETYEFAATVPKSQSKGLGHGP
jgi:hypothetical protein